MRRLAHEILIACRIWICNAVGLIVLSDNLHILKSTMAREKEALHFSGSMPLCQGTIRYNQQILMYKYQSSSYMVSKDNSPMLPEEHRSRSNSRAAGVSPYAPPTPQIHQPSQANHAAQIAQAQAAAYQQQLMQQQQEQAMAQAHAANHLQDRCGARRGGCMGVGIWTEAPRNRSPQY